MTLDDIKRIVDNCSLPDSCNNVELKETHISWIILTDRFAFKIKRPVKFAFADFSSADKRKYFCEREIELNKRLAEQMYIDVLPIHENQLSGSNSESNILDYAVKMKRMDESREMDILLKNDGVTSEHIVKVAKTIARFHHNSPMIKNTFNVNRFQELYEDIKSVSDFVNENLGNNWTQLINENVEASREYLNANRDFLNQRVISGFIRDCHGDLNAKNIFLYDEPIVFDCIEFNDDLRQIDVLNEIAFFCVDLDFFDKSDFSELFYREYLDAYGTLDNDQTAALFHYYKNYRANIRAKVSLLHAKNNEEGTVSVDLNHVKKYLTYMNDYRQQYQHLV